MSSIVIDLQNEITSSECDIVMVLRRAHVIATKLELSEFDQWITNELNGYPNQDACPNYRIVRGVLKGFNPYQGWIPTMISDSELEKMICEVRVPNSISEIVSLCKTSENGLVSEFTGEKLKLINELFDSPIQMRYALHLSSSSVSDIVEKVKNTILEWTLKLESEGVLGEGMRFSNEEKQNAQSMPQTINNYFGATNVINAPSENMQIVSGNESVTFSYGNADLAIAEIERAITQEQLNQEDRDAALEMLAEIKDKIVQEKKPSIIKASLIGLKDFMISAGSSLVAGIIQAKIQGLF